MQTYVVPWPSDAQVEQDLVICRALVEIFNHDFLKDKVAFRGGTALHKLYITEKSRYSEDIDLVLIKDEKYAPIIEALREIIAPWLGKPNVDQSSGTLTFRFSFQSEIAPTRELKLKVEINTKEQFNVLGIIQKDFSVESPWFSGSTKLNTFHINELLGTKLRALYQRIKGRDLFDMDIAYNNISVDAGEVVKCFEEYINNEGSSISRAQYEENIHNKKRSKKFLNDISPLLRPGQNYDMENGFELLEDKFISLLKGAPWKGIV
jgi:predicted nucleotidyltransferase component of viral defense system